MKFLSLVKPPKYSRFEYTPRYYDPVKEDIKNRTELIKRELDAKTNDSIDTDYGLRLKGSFNSRRTHTREGSSSNPAALQLAIVAILGLTIYAYIQFGNTALYVLFFIAALYFYIKKRGFINRTKQ